MDQELGTDDSTQLFTTARRKAAINDGQAEFADLTECLIRQSTITITGGTREYDLNSSALHSSLFVRLAKQGVEFHYTDASSYTQTLSGDDLPRRDVEWLNRYETSWKLSTVAATVQQLPAAYYVRPDGPSLLLGFYPTPSTGSSASAKVIVGYVAAPPPMTSDTNEPFTVSGASRRDLRPYHQALVHYAAHHLEKLRRDDMASDRQLQKFLGYVTRYIQQMRPKGGTVLSYARDYWKRGASLVEGRRDPRT